MDFRKLFVAQLVMIIAIIGLQAQNVEVDVNLNIKHSVGGVSDFGRERHITVHTSITDTDWNGEEDKLDYLFEDLDAYFGRDNGSASWKFQYTKMDDERPNHPDTAYMNQFGAWWNETYETNYEDRFRYEYRAGEMIHGTNPHPTYPTLSYWYMCGEEGGTQWLPQNIETSAEWMVRYLDKYFVDSPDEEGEPRPMYWEVINEPDMKLNTGAFMLSSWEDIWEYHNLVAEGVKEKLGDRAPLIGGMTWGLHDLHSGDLNRYRTVDYVDNFYADDPVSQAAAAYGKEQVASPFLNTGTELNDWYQWDILWKGFIDSAGANMDFYSVHLYDWPTYDATGGVIRSGGHSEATLEMLEWYDVHTNGVANRKPIVLSEYGAVQGAWDYIGYHSKRYDWECMKPFSSMMMQFLERPDYIVKSMPFTPVKATWGDAVVNGTTYFYQYKMMRDDEQDGNWEWSDYIKWFELWSEVKGTRVDTRSTDPDIQVDCYIDGADVYLILNNLEDEATPINLNYHGITGNTVDEVKIKHLYLEGEDNIILDDNQYSAVPDFVELGGDATMIIKYTYNSPITPDETNIESKFYGESVSGGTEPHRVAISGTFNTFNVNGVAVPADPSLAEATLRITGAFYNDDDDKPNGHLSIVSLSVNGTTVETTQDWRGTNQIRSRWFGTMEIPIDPALLQANNTFEVDFQHVGDIAVVNLQVWDFSSVPGRTDESTGGAVTSVTVDPSTVDVELQRTLGLVADVLPQNANDKTVTWSSANTSIATVDPNSGVVTPVAIGTTTVTATASNGTSGSCTVNVVPFVPTDETSVIISFDEYTLTEGDTITLWEKVFPIDATYKTVTWSTSDGTIATVNQEGEVAAIAEGEALITVTTDNLGLTANCTLTVNPYIPTPVDTVTLNNNIVSIMATTTYQLVATIEPAIADNQNVSWSSNNTSVATVDDNGLVSAVAEGSATITVTAEDDGSYDFCVVNVVDGSNAITIEAETFTETGGTIDDSGWGGPGLGFGRATNNINWGNGDDYVEYSVVIPADGEYQITYYIGCPNDNSAITCLIDDDEVSTDVVPNNGLGNSGWDNYVPLIAGNRVMLTAGTYTVRLIASGTNAWQWNLDKFEFLSLGAFVPVESVSVLPTSDEINIGATTILAETVLPVDATNKAVTWSSDNTAIATVSDGVVTGVGKGVATITVTTINGGFTADAEITVNAPVTGVEVSPTADSVNVGETVQLTADVIPADADNPAVSWSSSDLSIATVSADGVVTGVSKGIATITVTTDEGGFEADATITVIVPVTGVSVNPTSVSIVKGNTSQLTAIVAPANASNTNVTWSSDDEDVATVDATGLVTAVDGGTAVITVTTIDGGFLATSDVTVTVPVSGVSIVPATASIAVTDGSIQLSAVIEPVNATNQNVTWYTSDDTYATVTDGLVESTGLGEQAVTISVVTEDGNFTGTSTINIINDYVEEDGVTVAPETASVEIGSTLNTLNATVSPANATNQDVTWSSDNEDVATVNPATGEVSAVGLGTVNIVATTYNTSFSDTCVVTVTPIRVDGVTLDNSTLSITIGNTATLTETVTPAEATNQSVTWETDNALVATVDNGEIEAIGIGSTTITVTTVDGGYTAECIVTVTGIDVDGVTLSPATAIITVEEEYTLTPTVTPGNATDKSVSWNSDDTDVATVSNGVVTGVAPGTAVITVTTNDGGYAATSTITVNAILVTNVEVVSATDSIKLGGTTTLTATVTPNNATDKSVTWSSDKPAIASVDSDGVVTGHSIGTAIITATANDGSNEQASATIAVVPVPVESITIIASADSVIVDSVISLLAVVTPDTATIKTVTWTSGNTSIATVNPSSGIVKGVAEGTVDIIATSADGEVVDIVTIQVVELPTSSHFATLSSVGLYPNPAKEQINITGLEESQYTVTVYNIQGIEVISEEINSMSDQSISVLELPEGFYIVKVQNGEITKTLEFTKID